MSANITVDVVMALILDSSGGWVREEGAGNFYLASREAVRERVGGSLSGLANRKDGVKQRCRTALQSRAEELLRNSRPDSQRLANVHPALALV